MTMAGSTRLRLSPPTSTAKRVPSGWRAAVGWPRLQELLRGADIRGGQWTSTKPFDLAPGPGAHLELLLRAVKPLRRIDRVAAVADRVAGMSREEAAYWHAQTFRR